MEEFKDQEIMIAEYVGYKTDYQPLWVLRAISKMINSKLVYYAWYNLKFRTDIGWITVALNKMVEEGHLIDFGNEEEPYCIITICENDLPVDVIEERGDKIETVCFNATLKFLEQQSKAA